MQFHKCQTYSLNDIPQPLSAVDILWQKRGRIKRILKRRLSYILNWLTETIGMKKKASNMANADYTGENLQPGDVVRIRSKEEIQSTLDRWNQLKGCAFMGEMWQHCGTEHKVFKLVKKFLDERDYLIKKCSGIVILEGVYCEGTRDFGSCDRSCFYFWRDEWLEKI